MRLFITPQILSIPPFLSTPWQNILSLHAVPNRNGTSFNLIVILSNQMRVIVPALQESDIAAIFEAHAQLTSQEPSPDALNLLSQDSPPLTSSMQHDPRQADVPNLPQEVLGKIGALAKVLGFDDLAEVPKPEPDCNCPFCQIVKAFHASEEVQTPPVTEQEVSEEDLAFRTWDIKQTADKLYSVTNPLDENEHYCVFLGDPIGCTCGNQKCEHIHAVLKS